MVIRKRANFQANPKKVRGSIPNKNYIALNKRQS